MKKIILLSMIIFILFLKSAYAENYFGSYGTSPFHNTGIRFSPTSTPLNDYGPSSKVGMSNPAAVYCNALGYSYEIINAENGQSGVCIFPDGTKCDEWQFLGGECGQSYSYCALNGYDVKTRDDGKSPISATYSICVNKTTKEEIGSVINLFNLVKKSVRSSEPVASQASIISGQNTSPVIAQSASLGISLPSSFDWRNFNGNWMTGVKDQGICGACWAFSTVGTIESEYKIFTNDKNANPDLSEEYLVSSCFPNNNCCGGNEDRAHYFFRDSGVPDDACMPYMDNNCGCNDGTTCGFGGTCNFCQCGNGDACGIAVRNCTDSTGLPENPASCSNSQCSGRCTDWGNRLIKPDYVVDTQKGPINDEVFRRLIKEAIFTNGPVTVKMDMTNAQPANDIFGCNQLGLLDHAVALVGWNDTGQFWIVRNSWGNTWDDDGYFNLAYGNCSAEFGFTYDKGFNMEIRNGDNRDGPNADVETFYSQPSPKNSFPVSCISQSAIWRDEGSYGDDAIVGITMDSSKCSVVGDDTVGDFEQDRRVDVVSLSQEYSLNPAQTLWNPWEMRNSSGYCDGSDCFTEAFEGSVCPSGYFPVSCLSESANAEDEGRYGEDDIVGITMYQNNICKVTAHDSVGDNEYKRKVGTVCLDVRPSIIWGNWETRNDDNHDGPDSRVETFESPTCPSGYFPVSCLSESSAESNQNYGEDGILDIRIFNGKCIVTARDEKDNGEHKRRVAAVCLPNVNEPPDGPYLDSLNNPPQCQNYDYAHYSSANQIRNYTGFRCNVTIDSYVTRVAVNDATSGDTGVLNTSNIEVYVDVKNTGMQQQSGWFVGVDFWKANDFNDPNTKTQEVYTWLTKSSNGNSIGLNGAGCSLVSDPNSNNNLDIGETIRVKCWVPASYFGSTSGNQRIMFSAEEKDSFHFNAALSKINVANVMAKIVCSLPSIDSDGGKNYIAKGVCSDYYAVDTACQKNSYKDYSLCIPRCNFGDTNCDLRVVGECAFHTANINECLSDENCTSGITEYYVSGSGCGWELKKCTDFGSNYFYLDGKCAAFITNITSPLNSSNYSKLYVPLSFNVGPSSSIGYSLNYQPLVTVSGPVNITNIPNGLNSIIVYANDSSGNMGSSNDTYFFYCLGDITGTTLWRSDRKVDIRDVSLVAKLFGCNVGNACYDPRADITGPNNVPDGKIDIRDVSTIAKQFGKTC